MYQQGLVEPEDATQNFFNNMEYMPQQPTDTKDVLAFRRWNASSWVRPMYFVSLLTISLTLIVLFIAFVDTGEGAIIFFGVVLILICCGGCLIFHRILFELVMAFLQLPKLIAAMERLANIVQHTNEARRGTRTSKASTGGYQTTISVAAAVAGEDQHNE